MQVTWRDRKQYKKCQQRGCDNFVLPPRRKCNSCRQERTKTTTLRPSNRGRNAHNGLSLTHPTASRVRRRGRAVPEDQRPHLHTSNWEFA